MWPNRCQGLASPTIRHPAGRTNTAGKANDPEDGSCAPGAIAHPWVAVYSAQFRTL